MPARTVLLLILANLAWALNVIVSKLAVEDLGVPPLFYAGLRALVTIVVLAPLLRPLPEDWLRTALVGLAKPTPDISDFPLPGAAEHR